MSREVAIIGSRDRSWDRGSTLWVFSLEGWAFRPATWRTDSDGRVLERKVGIRWEHRLVDPTNPNHGLPERVWAKWREPIEHAADVIGVPVAEVLALVCCESQGRLDVGGVDPWENAAGESVVDSSWGLCQTLTDTAYLVGRMVRWPRRSPGEYYSREHRRWLMPWRSMPRGGNIWEWIEWLRDPFVGVTMGALIYRTFGELRDCRQDPLLTYTAYNAGGLYVGNNRYGLEATQAATEYFVMALNASVDLLGEQHG